MNSLLATNENQDSLFLRAIYGACLGRQPDPAGFAGHMKALREGGADWAGVLASVINSEEFRLRFQAKTALETLHETRMSLFRQHLPAAERVVDLGGSSGHDPEGALFALGYPYAPKHLLIVDLPPEDRFTKENVESSRLVKAARGTEVEYVYRSLADLSFLPSSSVDLVVSGESIEHVTEEDADLACAEVFRVLNPGGHFCLDTPNAGLTRIQSPAALIHPEHKKEYRVSELKDKLTRAGFHLVRMFGIVPMPRTLSSRVFDYLEMACNKSLCDDPELGYCFYIHAVKPS